MVRKVVVFVLACAAALAQGLGQTVIRVEVNLVQVDAVVTDSKNNHVSNLKAGDFVVLQDGKAQTITNFSYVTTGNGTVLAISPPGPRTGVAAAPLAPAALKPADVRRMFALVVDDLGLSFESMAHVRDGLRKFVHQQMEPGDMVAIIRTSGGSGVLQQFTTDGSLLDAAIDHLKFVYGGVGVNSFEPVGGLTGVYPASRSSLAGVFAADADAADTQLRGETFLTGSLGALRYVIDGLRDLPGRKSVVLFSENMKIFQGLADDPIPTAGGGPSFPPIPSVVGAMRRLMDAANRASVVIYTIDPRGVPPFLPGPGRIGATRPAADGQREKRMQDSQQGLVMLAEDTGGLFIHDDNRIDDAIHQAVADTAGYYLIGYRPDKATFDAKSGEPVFHHIQVRVTRAGLHVRSRSGFFGESDTEAQGAPRNGHDELMHALTSPFSSGSVDLKLTTLFHQPPSGPAYLSAVMRIDANNIKFVEQPGGGQKATVDVAAMTFGEGGRPVDRSDRRFDIDLDAAQYAAAHAKGIVYRIDQPLQRPGPYQFRVALRDEASGRLGSASQFVTAPDLANGRLALSSILLRENAQNGSDVNRPEGRVTDADPAAGAAERVFSPGAALSYQYQIFNAQADAAGKTGLQVEIRIFRDGSLVYQGQPMTLDLAGQTTPKRLLAGGDMVLSKIPPGDYVLRLIVVDKLAKQKYQAASQWMDFAIRQ
jgi:VWFA-related protein